MATVTQEPKPISPRRTLAPGSSFSVRTDFERIQHDANKLLVQGLTKYQRMLNSRLLDTLEEEFARWLSDTERGIAAELKNIPNKAKEKWLQERLRSEERRRQDNQATRMLVDFLFQYGQRQINWLKRLRTENMGFRTIISKVRNERQRQQAILQYAEQLGGSPKQLQGDEQAFARWFDEEAVNDRYVRQLGTGELLATFVFERLGQLLGSLFALVHQIHDEALTAEDDCVPSLSEQLSGTWRRLSIEKRIQEALRYDGDPRIHAAALTCLRRSLLQFPDGLGEQILDKRTLLLLCRTAAEAKDDVWVQCEALSIVASIADAQSFPLMQRRLDTPQEGDDMFVRRHLYNVIRRRLLQGHPCDLILPKRKSEPSPFVRQAIAKVAFISPDTKSLWADYARHDEAPQVRAAALLAGIEVCVRVTETIEFLEVVTEVLQEDQDPFVLRTACHVVIQLLERLNHDVEVDTTGRSESHRQTVHAFYRQRIAAALVLLQQTCEKTPLRRWAAQTIEQAWGRMDSQAWGIIQTLRPILPAIKPGTTRRFPKPIFQDVSDEKLGRIMAVFSQSDFGYDIHRGLTHVHITRGPTFGFRLWRLFHEMSNAATDKRQALRHTVGRINTALMRAPSQILGELSETKIPGEPLTIAEDGTWRPFVPLLDDFVSVLNLSWLYPRTTRLFTSQGVTTITGPRSIWKRLAAAYRLNFRFAKLATKRNWDNDSYPASTFIHSMQKLGFCVTFRGYQDQRADGPAARETDDTETADDETVTRFFNTACLAPLLMLGSLVDSVREQFLRYADYFGSAFENSIEQLLIFTAVVFLLVIAKHFYSNYTFRQARRNIPISIGGWGTRGKSGTERLKAALIGAMGHGLVSKTTGCEAMFIHSDPFGEPLEIPLFRPYDKATIWEQRNLLMTASRLQPSVFLWECMALTPSYVDVLQRQWTCDDLATITNTYPDHEDLQGPAGHNVATTISGFVPLKSHLITTEEVMRPYVTESCRNAETTFRGVGWLESGLITDDVLERFPYQEHPDNVALVAAMGDELGVPYEASLKAMGDYLVPDLGVLKTHPVSTVRTRKIEFTNGMSANERFGCMGNWKRLGFDVQDPWEEPTTWVSGVVNNRADRVPRSKVFAKIIVEDMNADRYFLIGNNLKGLRGFIQQAWDEKASTLSLHDRGQPWQTEFAMAALKRSAWDFRQPTCDDHVQQKLRTMCAAAASTLSNPRTLNLDAVIERSSDTAAVKELCTRAGVSVPYVQSIFKHHSELLTALGEFQEMAQVIQTAKPQDAQKVEGQYVSLLEKWYFRKLVTVENYDATGEEVVACIVDETPPGFLNRTIGLQNIKGTGLDFVYRFQAWDACCEACKAAEADEPTTMLRGLQALVGMPAIGQLCLNRVRQVLTKSRSSNTIRPPDLQALLAQLESKLAQSVAESVIDSQDAVAGDQARAESAQEKSDGSLAEWQEWVVQTSEEFLDVNDSVRRRNTADAIYRDLAVGRISRQRAVAEIRKINKRQKGGWLTTSLASK